MKKCFSAILVLAVLLLMTAFADGGILPVLTTPAPENFDAVSVHAVLKKSTPSAYLVKGNYEYDYTGFTCDDWDRFGKALSQDGWTLTASSVDDKGYVSAEVFKNTATVRIFYKPHQQELAVTYPAWVKPVEYDSENPLSVDSKAASVLPELAQTISLHAVTGMSRPSVNKDGCTYKYNSLYYSSYSVFRSKLGEEGFSLVSAETGEDGTVKAVVTDGSVELTVSYNVEDQQAEVTYPLNVYPRDKQKYDDYTEVKTGETVKLQDGATAELVSWEAVDEYHTYYVSYNWIPSKSYYSDYYSGDGVQQVVVTFNVHYALPTERRADSLIGVSGVYYDGEAISYRDGNGTTTFCTSSHSTVSGNVDRVFKVGMALTEEQFSHPEKLALTFDDYDEATGYVWYADFNTDAQ